jgi:DNA-binding MarR family transcriptional regulator
MESTNDVLVELHRLQVLSFIGQKGPGCLPFSTAWDLASRLRTDVAECAVLLEELSQEGFVEPLPDSPQRLRVPLRLTQMGEGYVEWVRARSTLPGR